MTLNECTDKLLDRIGNFEILWAMDLGDEYLFGINDKGAYLLSIIDPLCVSKKDGRIRQFYPPTESEETLAKAKNGKRIYPKVG